MLLDQCSRSIPASINRKKAPEQPINRCQKGTVSKWLWKALIWGATCGAGVIAFLKAVANEIELSEANLRRLEQTERKALQKRRQMAGQEPTVTPAVAAAA